MVQTVKIRKEGNKIKLNFMYNTDLIDIMREHKGYFFYKEKAWVFPAYKQSELYDELTSKQYRVEIVTPENQTSFALEPTEKPKTESYDVWEEEGVIGILENCKKCKQLAFCNREGLCVRCK